MYPTSLVVFGLGNPGQRYARTRHNVGFMVADALADRLCVSFKRRLFHSYCIGEGSLGGRSFHLVKPLSFMNNSGTAVRDALRKTGHEVADILVVCDSLDLSPGNCRFRLRGTSGGQKGLDSIIRALGTDDFMRLSVGIGRPAHKGQVVEYVLSEPGRDEAALIAEGVARAVDGVLLLIAEGPPRVMNEINRKEPAS